MATRTKPLSAGLIWLALCLAVAVPVAVAASSPLLAWRQPVYIVAGLAGVAGFALMLVQPLLAAGYLPGIGPVPGRRVHRWIGGFLVMSVLLHVVGLWITSPPDVVDALLFASPTPFSVWGVLAMWLVFATAILALLRRRLRLGPRLWRRLHSGMALLIVAGTALHAVLIEGTMGLVTKWALCALVLGATVKVIVDLRVWARR